MKVIALNQQDANDTLMLLTSDALALKGSALVRVHQLCVALAGEARELVPKEELDAMNKERDELRASLEALKATLEVRDVAASPGGSS